MTHTSVTIFGFIFEEIIRQAWFCPDLPGQLVHAGKVYEVATIILLLSDLHRHTDDKGVYYRAT